MINNYLFHRVSPERDPLWDPMDVKLFDKTIRYISSHYQVVQVEELVQQGAMKPSEKIATILFDDGYLDNLEYAADILAKYKCKASFYVVTDCIENNTLTWTHVLSHLFANTNRTQLDLNFDFLPEAHRTSGLASNAERVAFVLKLKPFLKKLNHENRQLVLDRIAECYSDVELPKMMMNWQQVNELKSAGHYIGSHTAYHSMLGTIADEALVKNELIRSAAAIKANLGHQPISIAYPVGSYNETTKRLTKECGYQLGLAVNQKPYNPAQQDLYEIPRIELYNEPWWKTKMRITNRLENIKSIFGYR